MRIRLDIPIDTKALESNTGIRLSKPCDCIEYVCTDSRCAAEGDLYISLAQSDEMSALHIGEALKNGCYTVAESVYSASSADKRRALFLKLASYYKSTLPRLTHTVAITGSLGKTTTKEFTKALLSQKFKTHSTYENLNNEIGLAYTLLSAPRDTEVLILECGMNHSGELARLSLATEPDVAIITNVSSAHIGNLESLSAIAKAKLEINCGMGEKGITLTPHEEPLLASAKNRRTVSTENPRADFFLFPLSEGAHGSVFDFYSENRIITAERILVPGEHILKDLSFALAAASVLKLSYAEIARGLAAISPDHLRQKLITIGRYRILDDTYSSSPEAVANMLKLVTLFEGERAALLGDMLELGKRAEAAHYEVGIRLAELGFKKLYTYGPLASHIARGARDGGLCEACIFTNPDLASPNISAEQIETSYGGELILFKASHDIRADRILKLLNPA